MSSDHVRADAPRYPIVSSEDAANCAEAVLADFDLATDVGLEDRLQPKLGQWMDEHAASYLSHEVKHLYWLLVDPRRTQADKPIDAVALRRALTLALSRPSEDECWRDYQRVQDAIYQRWLAVGAELRSQPLRRLFRRARSDRAAELAAMEKEWQRPIAEAQAAFVEKWRR